MDQTDIWMMGVIASGFILYFFTLYFSKQK